MPVFLTNGDILYEEQDDDNVYYYDALIDSMYDECGIPIPGCDHSDPWDEYDNFYHDEADHDDDDDFVFPPIKHHRCTIYHICDDCGKLAYITGRTVKYRNSPVWYGYPNLCQCIPF